MFSKKYAIPLFFLPLLSANIATAANTLNNPTIDTVILKTNCGSLNNCADNLGELLNWIWDTRQPDNSNPLSVEIGPGNFAVPSGYLCDGNSSIGRGHVSFNGSGRDVTSFVSPSPLVGVMMTIRDCDEIAFQDMAFDGDFNALTLLAVIKWLGGGSSTWTNVNVTGNSQYLWDELGSSSGNKAVHYWFGAKFNHVSQTSYGAAYSGKSGESWIYNSDILSTDGGGGQALGIYVSGGDVRIFGSTVRVIVPATSNIDVTAPVADRVVNMIGGLLARNTGQIHMHGGIVAVRAMGTGDVNIFGSMASGSTLIHTPDTAYVGLQSGVGTTYTRNATTGGASVDAPFQWPSSSQPPQGLISIDGADTFIETDCSLTGNCNAAGSFPHVMVYSSACGSGNPWFDSTVNSCRQ